MANARCNGIRIEYETFGNRKDRPLLLVMGLGGQMIHWDEAFCEQLADRGHFVVRFDNRDVGLSEKFDAAGVPDMMKLMTQSLAGEPVSAPYSLDDMADDAAGLLDHLDIESAHICGASMGGMIVQTMAIRHGDRVRSMTSIMSTTGNPEVPPGKPEAMAALMSPAGTTLEEVLDRAVAIGKVIGSPAYPREDADARARAKRAYERSFYPVGVARQMAAIAAGGNRKERLLALSVPALVIHGIVDPLVPVEGGHDTHAALRDSELVVIEGMGHDLPEPIWPQIIDPVTKLTTRAHT